MQFLKQKCQSHVSVSWSDGHEWTQAVWCRWRLGLPKARVGSSGSVRGCICSSWGMVPLISARQGLRRSLFQLHYFVGWKCVSMSFNALSKSGIGNCDPDNGTNLWDVVVLENPPDSLFQTVFSFSLGGFFHSTLLILCSVGFSGAEQGA